MGLIMRLSRCVPALLVACGLSFVPALEAAESGSVEYQVKAAFLAKFGLYVEWPAAALAPNSTLNLCIVGDDPFGPLLDKTASSERIGGHAIAVRRLKTVGRDSGCHILYAGGSDSQRISGILEAVRGASILTVTDQGAGGIIDFVIKDNRVRFDINDEAAGQNGLTISSKLLDLALNVKTRRGEVR